MRVMDKQSFEEAKERKFSLKYGEPYKLDKYDILILKALNKDARQSLAELSSKVKLSRDAIRNRIRKMIKAEVIHAFKPILNPPKIGYPIINYVFISLFADSPETEKKFSQYVMNHPNITYAASLIGKWDYVLYIFARNPGEFSFIMKELRQRFPKLIKDYDVYGVLEEFKYDEGAEVL